MKDDKSRDSDMIEKIKKEANVAILHDESDGCFLSWGSTTNGAEDLEKYVKAAIELNYMVWKILLYRYADMWIVYIRIKNDNIIKKLWQTKKTKSWMSLDAAAQSLKILVRSLRVL